MRHPANWITAGRILLSFALLRTAPLSGPFLWCYAGCGLSDMLDGWVARKTGTAGRGGAALDSGADLVFAAAALWKLLPVLLERLPGWVLPACGGIAALRLAAYGVGFVKFRRFAALHLRSNKLTGLALFLSPWLLTLWEGGGAAALLCALTGLSALEELVCMVRMKRWDPELRSILAL